MSNFIHIHKIIMGKIQNTAHSDVKKITQNEMKNSLEEIVYSYRTKNEENRRKENGGLKDEANIQMTEFKSSENSVRMTVENKATGRAGFEGLTEVTEKGTGGNWNGEPPARPFIKETKNKLANGKLKNTVKAGLIKRGLRVK